jgi:hypothetical protein
VIVCTADIFNKEIIPQNEMSCMIKENVLKSCLLFILLFSTGNYLVAQSKFSLTGGWGYYEQINIGAQWNISKISSLSLYGGTNLIINETKVWTAGLSFDQTFQKPVVWKLQPGYSLGILFWTSNDDLYYFKNISYPIMAILAYPVSRTVMIKAEGGILLTKVLLSDRKQNVEAGYPQRFNGNVRLSLIYKLGVK